MAFPTPGTPATYSENTGTISVHPVTLPAGMTVGNKLIIAFVSNSSSAVTTPAGYALLGTTTNATTFDNCNLFVRDIDGTEGSTVNITVAANQRASAVAWETSGGRSGLTTSEIAISGPAEQTGSAAPDPPSLSPVPGADDYIWYAIAFAQDGSTTYSSPPTNYTTLSHVETDSGAGNAVAVAYRHLNAASENPGAFTFVTSRNRCSFTVAVRPSLKAFPPLSNPYLPFLVR